MVKAHWPVDMGVPHRARGGGQRQREKKRGTFFTTCLLVWEKQDCLHDMTPNFLYKQAI